MGIPVALHGFGGGGTSLNFKVAGNPQPASSCENTIWLNTDVPITGYAFSPVEPEAPEAGMVWILTSTSSTVSFNALKKNSIEVYPISAKQYIDGAWVSVEAKSYQNGEWVSWFNGYFYNAGTFFADYSEKKDPDTASITYDNDYIELKTVASTASEVYVVVGPVNMSSFSEINADFIFPTAVGSGTILASLFVSKTNGDSYKNAVASNQWTTTTQISPPVSNRVSLDVTSLSGDYFIHVGTHTQGSNWSLARTVRVSSIGGVSV